MKGVTENKKVEALENQTHMQTAVNTIFAHLEKYSQRNAKAAMKVSRGKAAAATIKEFEKLNKRAVPEKKRPVIGPQDISELSQSDRSRALQTVNLIKEK